MSQPAVPAFRSRKLLYLFENYALDADRRELRRGTSLVPVQPQVFDLLEYLIRNRERVVSKDDLIAAVWGGRIVSESALSTRINAARTAIGDCGEQQRLIRTLPRKGVRFVGTLQEEQRTAPVPAPNNAEPPKRLPGDRPSIAVLPFQNMSGDPNQDYFADGMVEEIITALSRIRWLFVIARNSSFTYKGRAVDVKQVGKELGVLYVLEGSVRKAGNRIRITAQLLDATTDAHLWADRFDGMLEDVFELQDHVASSVAGVIGPTLQAAEHRRSIQRPTTDLAAYDLYLRARAGTMSWEREGVMQALDLLGQALKHDAHYGLALAHAAFCHLHLDVNGWSKDRRRNRQNGVDLARRALQATGDDANVLGYAAYVLGYFEPDINPAITLIDRALDLNPSFAFGWAQSGWLRSWAGQTDVAIEHFEKSLRLNPLRRAPATFGIAVGHFFARRLEKAAAMLSLTLQEHPNWPPCLRFLASCYAHMGRLEDAQSIVEMLRDITPDLIPSGEHWRVRENRSYYLEGLRLAVGVAPEEVESH
jgi:TolB-like protein/Tfp pilus assembly protein PilF